MTSTAVAHETARLNWALEQGDAPSIQQCMERLAIATAWERHEETLDALQQAKDACKAAQDGSLDEWRAASAQLEQAAHDEAAASAVLRRYWETSY